MSAKQFIGLLQTLGFEAPNGVKLQPSGVEWLFVEEKTRPVLSWLCHALRETNVLTQNEAQVLNDLLAENKLLVGSELDEAMASMKVFTEESASLQTLEEETTATAEELDLLRARVARLASQRDRLNTVVTATRHQTADLRRLEARLKDESARLQEQATTSSTQYDTALRSLGDAVVATVGVHTDSGVENPLFVSRVPSSYEENDDKYTRELRRLVDKQFEVKHDPDEHNRYTWLKISKPGDLLVRGESERVYAEYCAELLRLKLAYTASASQEVDACALQACRRAQHKVLSDRARLQKRITESTVTLRADLDRARERLARVRAESTRVREEDIAAHISALAELQQTGVLGGDYDLKIKRQEYQASKQERVIEHLINQQARHLVLSGALQAEMAARRRAHELLSSIESSLAKTATRHANATVAMAAMPAREDGIPATLDPADGVMAAAHRLLPSGEPSMPLALVPAAAVADAASTVHGELQRVTTERRAAVDTSARELAKLQGSLSRLHDILYAHSTTSQPILTLPALATAHQSLEVACAELSDAMDVILRDRQAKLQTMQYHPQETIAERRRFVDVFGRGARRA